MALEKTEFKSHIWLKESFNKKSAHVFVPLGLQRS